MVLQDLFFHDVNSCRYSHELAPSKKTYDPPREHIKKQRHYLPTKVHIVRVMVFPVVMYGYERWTIKKAVQFSSVTQSYQTLCNPINRSMQGLPGHHQLLEFTQTHVHRVGDAIQPSHPLSSPSPPAPNSF